MKLTLILSGFIGISTMIAGCKSQNPMNTDAVVTPQQPPLVLPQPRDEKPQNPKADRAAIVLSVETDKTTLKRGETITLTLKARNTSDEARSLTFSSGQRFDFTATPANATPPAANEAKSETQAEAVWRWSEDKIFNMSFGNVMWQPGEQKTWSTKWDGSGRNGAALPRGGYQIGAQLTSRPRVTAEPIVITLAE
ncbi:MAG: hypothetical protein JWN98_2135 [Abditibacteriota bacterium]|nr:hypothetical protein [Abditibacteriota bacterium]